MATLTSAQSSIHTIDQYLARVGGQTKVAGDKTADGSTPLSEPGSIGGATTHPVKSVDDRLQKAPEGERSKENAKDVKEEQGAPSVENAPEAKAKSALDMVSRLAKTAGSGMCPGCHKQPCSCTPAKKAEDSLIAAKIAEWTKKAADARVANDVSGVTKAMQKLAKWQKRAEGGAVQTSGSAADDAENSPLNPQPTGQTPQIETSGAKAGKEDKKQGDRGGTSHPASTENDSIDGHKWASLDLNKQAEDIGQLGNSIIARAAWHYQNMGDPKKASDLSAQAGKPAQAPVNKTAAAPLDGEVMRQLGWEMGGLVSGTLDKQAADAMVRRHIDNIIRAGVDDAEKVAHFYRTFHVEQHALAKQAEGGMPPPGSEEPPLPPPDAGGGEGGGEEGNMMAALAGGGGPGGGEGGVDPQILQLAKVLESLGISPEEFQQAMLAEGGGEGGGEPPMPPDAGGGMPGGMPGGLPPGPPGMEAQASARGRPGKVAVDKNAMTEYVSEIIQRSRAKRGSANTAAK